MSEPLYHGTDNISLENIINSGINVNQNPRGGDFAVGFYLTPDLQTAKAMAFRKSFSHAQPGIVELTLKKDFHKYCNVKKFPNITSYSSENDILTWAQFIVNNRCGLSYIQKVSAKNGFEDNNIDKRYDIVIGTIADGSVNAISRICKSENRIISINEAKEFLDKMFGIQYCISTERGLHVIEKIPREKKGVHLR